MTRHQEYLELLQLQADGEITRAESGRLDRHLRSCGDCRRERAELARLAELLTGASIRVRPGFREEVLARLPAAGWESRHPMSWAAGVAVFVILAGLAAALTGWSGAASAPVAGAILAVLDLFRSSMLAGAGLLSASWRGVGLALGRLFDGSIVNLVAFGVLVLGLDLLFLRLLLATRRAVRAASEAASPSRAADRS